METVSARVSSVNDTKKCSLLLLLCFLAFNATGLVSEASAENIRDALARSYIVSPELNAQRANTRAVDEVLPQAKGQWLPQATGQGNVGVLNQQLLSNTYSAFGFDGVDLKTITNPVGANLLVTMNIFNGFRGINGINQAEAQIHQARELLRNTEMAVLGQAATAYMNLLRDTAVYEIQTDAVKVYEKQVSDTKEKLNSGEGTVTEVYQAEEYLAEARRQRVNAFNGVQASIAAYKQIIQTVPSRLSPANPVDSLIPKKIDEAIRDADAHHPLARAARYNVEISQYAVKLAEGQLAPTVNLQGRFGQQWNFFGTSGQRLYVGEGSVQVNVPIYEGGVYYSAIRQAKEKRSEAQLLFDRQINKIHQEIETYWAQWQNASKYLTAARERVKSAEAALSGLREGLKYGQGTTWDVLNYQSRVYAARIEFVTAQRDRVLSCYNLVFAIGSLSADTLGLDVPKYEVADHYNRVKNQFFGVEPWK
jgi:outer membrane protein